VKESWAASAEGSGVAHSLQNLESAGFSVVHLGQCVIIIPLSLLRIEYKFVAQESNGLGVNKKRIVRYWNNECLEMNR
jgi:hypothetical protein